MLGREVGIYWRFCWGALIPVALTGMFVYSVADFEPVEYKGVRLPREAQCTAHGSSKKTFGKSFFKNL